MKPTDKDHIISDKDIKIFRDIWMEPGYSNNNIYVQIFTHEMIINTFNNRLGSLDQNINIITEENHKLSYMSSGSIKLYYHALRPEIERIGDYTVTSDFLQDVSRIYKEYQQIEQNKIQLLNSTESQIRRIDKLPVNKAKEELAEFTERYNRLIEKKPEKHPFFPNVDEKNRTFVFNKHGPRGRLFGANTKDALYCLLKAQNSTKTAEDIKWELRRYDRGRRLESIFSALEDQQGYKYGKILRFSLQRALSKGAIMATLDNSAIIDHWEEHLRHDVILDRFEPDNGILVPAYVIVVDGLIPDPYKVIDFEFPRVWTGDVFAPKDALP